MSMTYGTPAPAPSPAAPAPALALAPLAPAPPAPAPLEHALGRSGIFRSGRVKDLLDDDHYSRLRLVVAMPMAKSNTAAPIKAPLFECWPTKHGTYEAGSNAATGADGSEYVQAPTPAPALQPQAPLVPAQAPVTAPLAVPVRHYVTHICSLCSGILDHDHYVMLCDLLEPLQGIDRTLHTMGMGTIGMDMGMGMGTMGRLYTHDHR